MRGNEIFLIFESISKVDGLANLFLGVAVVNLKILRIKYIILSISPSEYIFLGQIPFEPRFLLLALLMHYDIVHVVV